MNSVTAFNRAIVRNPAQSVTGGLRADDRGDPSLAGVEAEHTAYIAALRTAGVEVTRLPPLEAFPDSVFVEDPALVFTEGAILLRAAAASRDGEADELARWLGRFEVDVEGEETAAARADARAASRRNGRGLARARVA